MGSSFYLGWLIPRETSLVIWGVEGKGAKVKGSKAKSSFPFTDYCPNDSQKEKKFHWIAPAYETRQIRLKECAAVVSTSKY
jgi:hypothetical protein